MKKLEPQDRTTKFTQTALKKFNLLKAEYGFRNASIALEELIKNYREQHKI
jgi:hypothetical protein